MSQSRTEVQPPHILLVRGHCEKMSEKADVALGGATGESDELATRTQVVWGRQDRESPTPPLTGRPPLSPGFMLNSAPIRSVSCPGTYLSLAR